MEGDFWRERWASNRIGFHEGAPNAFLVKHRALLGPKRRVLVPLCGKAEDLGYLASLGHEVVGVELVPQAVEAYFAEHGLTPKRTPRGAMEAFEAGGVTILAGDFFATRREDVGGVSAFYDRAAVIALPPTLRARYAAHLRTLVPKAAPGVVITVEYDQTKADGPPFSVPEAELRSLHAGSEVTFLGEAPAENSRLRDAGVQVVERCYHVVR